MFDTTYNPISTPIYFSGLLKKRVHNFGMAPGFGGGVGTDDVVSEESSSKDFLAAEEISSLSFVADSAISSRDFFVRETSSSEFLRADVDKSFSSSLIFFSTHSIARRPLEAFDDIVVVSSVSIKLDKGTP